MFILIFYGSLIVKTSHFLLFTPRRPWGTGNIHSIHSKWVNDCCLTPNHSTAICNHSMICFLLSEHAYFGIYGTSSLQQQATGRHYPDSESISLLLLLNDAYWRESSKSKFHTFGLTWWGLEPRIYPAPETITLTITTPMCLLLTSECYVSNYYRWGGHIIFYISVSRIVRLRTLSRV